MDLRLKLFSFLLLSTLFCCHPLAAQVYRADADPKAKKLWQEGVAAQRKGDKERAIRSYMRAIKAEPAFMDAIMELGAIYFSQGAYDSAAAYFDRAIALDTMLPARVYFTAALCYWETGRYQQAQERFDVLLLSDEISESQRKKALKHARDSRFYHSLDPGTKPAIPQPLGPGVNTSSPEYLPGITADGKRLLFTRRLGGQEDFFLSQRQPDGTWGEARPLHELNTPRNEGAMCISADGRTIVFTLCNEPGGVGGCDLYWSEKRQGKWAPPRNMGPVVNSEFWESQPALSPDGDVLYFVSNRPGGMGDMDIWMSRFRGGNWTPPRNLGEPVNTIYDELTPFMHFDDQTLFFASAGHPGLGGLDLFSSRRRSDGNWGKPVNLGPGINTRSDESGLVVDIGGQTAIFSIVDIDREGYMKDAGLYQAPLPEAARARPSGFVRIRVLDTRDSAQVVAGLRLHDLADTSRQIYYRANKETETLVCLPLGTRYALFAEAPGFLSNSVHFDLPPDLAPDAIDSVDIWLTPLPTGGDSADQRKPERVVLNNIFFETGSARLLPDSHIELDRWVALLGSEPVIRIHIHGHTDNTGTAERNQVLSEQRARAVYDYLVSKGVPAERMSWAGFGQTRPVAGNETAEGRRLNRRTEFEISR